MEILISVENQKLKTPTYLNTIVEGTQNFVRFRFNLGKDWDGLRVFAQFAQNGVAYNKYLDNTNSVYLPTEIVMGNCTLLLYGSDDNVIATTNFITLKIDENMLVEGSESTDITPSLYQQLVTLVNAMDGKCDDTLASVQALVDSKVDSVEGMGLSTNDFSDEYKAKLEGVSAGAEVNVQSDWNETDTTSDSYINNKPTKVSAFENDADYATRNELQEATTPLATKNELNQLQNTMSGELQELRDDVGNNVDVRLGEIEQEMGNLATKTELENVQNTISQQLSDLQEEVGANVDSRLTEIETEMGGFATKVEVSSTYATKEQVSEIGDELDLAKEELQQYAETHGVDGLLYENNLLYLTANGEIVSDSVEITGGGGGGASNNAVLTLNNTTGWIYKTFAEGAICNLTGTWSSIEDGISTGAGSLIITVDGVTKRTKSVGQGDFSENITEFLKSGSNAVKLIILDVYGNRRIINYSIDIISLQISSTFNDKIAYSGDIDFTYVPQGNLSKTIHFVLDDNELETRVIATSNTQKTYTIQKYTYDDRGNAIELLTHGSHKFEVYFTAIVNGAEVQSNRLSYSLICIEEGNNAPIISVRFNKNQIMQYETVNIPYIVYSPANLTSLVNLYANGVMVNREPLTVDRTLQTWAYRPDEFGELLLEIRCGQTTKQLDPIEVSELVMPSAEAENLELYLTSYGRSNNETNRASWGYNNIACSFENYNWKSDGWIIDKDGITTHRISGDAKLTIPLRIFENDFRTTGKTIEFEFATRDVLDYDAEIISCMSGNRGFRLTAQRAILKSRDTEIFTQYKEDEHIRLSFVIEKTAENRLILIYIDGIICGAIQYPESDIFSQIEPLDIVIGSNQCTIDLYNVRVYNNSLTRYQILDNWIADTQNINEKVDRFNRNQVYDDYGNISIQKLPADLPYLILSNVDSGKIDVIKNSPLEIKATGLPPDKGVKRLINCNYIDPIDDSNNFEFDEATIDVQGTSSKDYPRKNYKIKFSKTLINSEGKYVDKNGNELGVATSSSTIPSASKYKMKYGLRPNSVPVSTFTFKADYASSEGCNNVELVRLYNTICPYKTPPQEAELLKPAETRKDVRQGIDGFPIVMFYNDGVSTSFVGKYNFNNDKGTEDTFGFTDNREDGGGYDESWEILDNRNRYSLFKDDDFEVTYINAEGDEDPLWLTAFEARFPEENMEYERLQRFSSWVKSTNTETATNDLLANPVVYNGTTYTNDTSEYRLAKFKNELSDYANVTSSLFYYIFTELFLMTDSRAKNAFPTIFDSEGKVCWLPYDMDTALGIDNMGNLTFGYELEDTDMYTDSNPVYNGADSVFWVNIRKAFRKEIMSMYQGLRNNESKVFSYENIESEFEKHQAKWCEAIWNEDAYFKYIEPLITTNENQLPKLQGSKKQQRKWWLYNRFRYIDSKYNCPKTIDADGKEVADSIHLRAYRTSDIDITPYADIYTSVMFAQNLTQQRALKGGTYTHRVFAAADELAETETYIYSASQLKSVGNLSGLKPDDIQFNNARRINEIIVGSDYLRNSKGQLITDDDYVLHIINEENEYVPATEFDDNEEYFIEIDNSMVSAEPVPYENSNLKTISIGSNTLLRTVDIRNCSSLTQNVDLSNCANVETVLCEGTNITGVSLPSAGILKTLHLPDSIASLIIMNQPLLSDFELNNATNISTLRIENTNTEVDSLGILNQIVDGSNVRLIGFEKDVSSVEEIETLYSKFDKMSGLDEFGNAIVGHAQLSGDILIDSISYSDYASFVHRATKPYNDVKIKYNTMSVKAEFYNDDAHIENSDCIIVNSSSLGDPEDESNENIFDSAEYTGNVPQRASTREYDYTFVGWTRDAENTTILSTEGFDGEQALNDIRIDTPIYAVYLQTPRQYQIVLKSSNSEIANAEFDYGTDLSWSELSGNVFVKKDNEPVITIATPTKSATNEKVFDFNGWCRNIADESVNNAQDDSVIQNLGEEAGDLSDNVMVPRIAHAHFNWDWRPYNIPFYNVELAPNKIDNTPTANPIATLVTKYGFSPNVAGILPTRASDGCTYTFNGWTTDYTKFISTDTDYYFGIGEELPVIQGSVSEIGNVKYYAHYSIEPNQYAVTFNKNNGSSGSNSVTATYSSAMPSITPPTRTGYTFLGYFDGGNTKYYNANGTSAKNWDKWEVPQGGFSLIAHWQANSYGVKYNGNNSTSGSMANTTHTYDVAKALSENQFNRAYTVTFDYKGATSGNTIANLTSHYGFLGWATTSSGAKAYDNKQSVTNLASEQGSTVNLYAVWQPVSVTLPSPVRTGYTFGGWCTDNACTNIVRNGGAGYTPSNNITLYAKWTANNYTITFNGNKGSGSSTPSNVSGTKQATYDSAMPTATMPTRAGYDFQGYYDAATGGTKYYNANGTSAKNWNKTSNTTLYARWSAKSYTVYFKSENGSETYYTTSCAFDSTPVYSDTTPTKPDSDPTLDFEFVGWSTSMNSTGSYSVIPPAITTEGNKTYYARYVSTPQKYTISFNNNGTVINIQCGYGEIPSESQTYSQSVIPHLGTDFAGWVPRVSPVSGNTSYTAVYRETTGLNGMTWDRISEISQAGIAPEIFTIGDCKEVVLNGTMGIISFSNTKLYAYIIGFNHNPEIEETILGQDSAGNSIYTTSITFGTFRTDLTGGKSVALYDGYNSHNNINGEKYFNLSHWCTQRTNIFGNVVYDAHLYGGWAACDMRYDILGSTNVPPTGYGRDRVKGDTGNDPTSDYIDTNGNLKSGSLTTTLLACLPSELRKVMKPMKKYTNNVASDMDNNLSWITSTFDYLPLLAEYEIFGEVEDGNIYEDRFQSRYEYYLRGNSRNKYRHNNIGYELDWWTRTPSSGLSGVKVNTGSSGGSSTSIGGDAENSCGVAPIFKV